jgi:serine/threonine protein kinase
LGLGEQRAMANYGVQAVQGVVYPHMLAIAAAAGDAEPEAEQDKALGKYLICEKLGEGAYGMVYKAIHRETKEVFAIKKIRIVYAEEGVPSTAIREISLLKECDHPHVIKLHEVIIEPKMLGLVFDFLEKDLHAYLKDEGPMFQPELLRNAAGQLFSGMDFCHVHRIIHRDLKPKNILIDVATRQLKLADFGLARAYSVPLRAYSRDVVTLWYRAPEILLGQKKYATPTDIWSLGCVVAEMATGQALFPGDSEIDTIFRIFRLLGTPNEEVWPGLYSLPDFKREFPQWRDTALAEVAEDGPALGPHGIDLVRSCFRYNPLNRPSAQRLLQHTFFDVLECLSGSAEVGHQDADLPVSSNVCCAARG